MRRVFTETEREALLESARSSNLGNQVSEVAHKALKTARAAIVKAGLEGLSMSDIDTFTFAVDRILDNAASQIASKASSLVVDAEYAKSKKAHKPKQGSHSGSWAGPGDDMMKGIYSDRW